MSRPSQYDSQRLQVLAALQSGERLTPRDAIARWGCYRLGARVWELRHGVCDGVCWNIMSKIDPSQHFSIYWLGDPAVLTGPQSPGNALTTSP